MCTYVPRDGAELPRCSALGRRGVHVESGHCKSSTHHTTLIGIRAPLGQPRPWHTWPRWRPGPTGKRRLSDMWTALLVAVLTGGLPASPTCDATGAAADLRARAAALYSAGDYTTADACIAAALVAVTGELELLAAQAQALRSFRAARQQAPNLAPTATGCVVDATGTAVCLPELASAAQTIALGRPTTAQECGSEEAAVALLASQQEVLDAKGTAAEAHAAHAPLDAFIIQSAQRHWVRHRLCRHRRPARPA